MDERVILVNEKDEETGTMEKLEAHEKGVLHRAISVFIFNYKGEMLLQQRAFSKYHSGGLFSNACCSHPRPGESVAEAASRRLREEMGLDVPLEYKTSFIYRATFNNGLTEHEFDHVFTGTSSQEPSLNPFEAASYKWLSMENIREELKTDPEKYTYWFRVAVRDIFQEE
jgi:isopentenyl-diphosphate Delta-isomerase